MNQKNTAWKPLLAAGLALAAWRVAAAPAAENWPQWRGPERTGASPTAEPPVSWSETQNVRWKVRLPGEGTGAPVIWGDRIFLQAAVPTGKKVEGGGAAGAFGVLSPSEAIQFALLCLDRATGKVLWQKVAREEVPHEGHHPDHGYASQAPVTDGEHVWASFGSHGVYCYDFQGNPVWTKDLGRMQTKNQFGEGSSPALHGDTLVINWDHEGADFIVALDKKTGNEKWRQPREEDTSWSTPLIVEHGGKAQVVTAATRRVRSYDLETGQPLWEAAGLTRNTIPTPVAGDGMVYLTAGFQSNVLVAIRLGRTGDLTGTDAIAWRHNRSTPYVPSPLLYQGRLYFLASNNAILSCFDAKTGQPHFSAERIEGLQGVYASPVGAAGRVYLVGRNGTSVVLKASDKLEVLATNVLEDKVDSSPALAGKDLVLRGHQYLYCLAGK